MSAIDPPVIRRRAMGRRLDPREIARLDADALRQRRRRAAKRASLRAAPTRPSMIWALLAALGLVGGVLLASGSLRLDLGKAMAETPSAPPLAANESSVQRTAGDPALFARLDEISQGLVQLRGDLKTKSRPAATKTAAAQPLPRPMIEKAAIARDEPGTWRAPRGTWSSEILRRWSEQAGVDLDWQADIDIQLDAPIEVAGNFEDAVTSLLDGLAHKSPRPKGQLHLNRKTGRPALVVLAEGNPDG